MPRPMVLGLLLACVVSLSSSAVVTENGQPILWQRTTGLLSELPTKNDVVTPNPWHYLQRMSMIRIMIAATDKYMSSMGTNATDSCLWGLTVQLGWFKTSGRLADPTGATTCGLQTGDTMCISPQSFYGCVNYFANVLPFLSAAQQGLMGAGLKVKMEVPEGVTDYCTSYDECTTKYADAMKKWDAFFQALKTEAESPLPVNEKRDHLLSLYWAGQDASTHAATGCNARQTAYSSKEVQFANSWLDCGDYVSATHFHTSFDKTIMFAKPLPGRILQESDVPPNIADMSEEENHILYIFSWMSSINNILGGRLVRLWRSAMCSATTREKGRQMLEDLMLNPGYTPTSFMSIATGMTTSC